MGLGLGVVGVRAGAGVGVGVGVGVRAHPLEQLLCRLQDAAADPPQQPLTVVARTPHGGRLGSRVVRGGGARELARDRIDDVARGLGRGRGRGRGCG